MRGKYTFAGQVLTAREIRQQFIPIVKSDDWVIQALRDGCTTQAELIARFETRARRKTTKPPKDHPLRGTYK